MFKKIAKKKTIIFDDANDENQENNQPAQIVKSKP